MTVSRAGRRWAPIALGVALAGPPAPALADGAGGPPVQELFLGESAWTQEAGALQAGLQRGWMRRGDLDAWSLGGGVEVGLTDRLQVQVEGERTDAPAQAPGEDTSMTAAGGGVLYGIARGDGWRTAIGFDVSSELAAGAWDTSASPHVSTALSRGRWSASVTGTAAAALPRPGLGAAGAAMVRVGPVTPLAEVAVEREGASASAAWSGGLVFHGGPFEIAAAAGARSGAEPERSVRAVLTWETEP